MFYVYYEYFFFYFLYPSYEVYNMRNIWLRATSHSVPLQDQRTSNGFTLIRSRGVTFAVDAYSLYNKTKVAIVAFNINYD